MKKNKDHYIEQYSLEAITISIDAKVPEESRCVADLRLFVSKRQLPHLPRMDLMPHIIKLQQLGCDYIDIGYSSDWIAVEIPVYVRVLNDDVSKIIALLHEIKDGVSYQKEVERRT